MTVDRLTRTVREQVALGRLLPLGGAQDAAWITEQAAVRMLRRAAAALPGLRLGAVSVVLDEPGEPDGQAAPVGALPHVPLRIEAGFLAGLDEPLRAAADRLRGTLWDAAADRIGLTVRAVDLQVTGLLEGGAAAGPQEAPDGGGPEAVPDPEPGSPAGAVRAAVVAVPGVVRLTRRLPALGSGVRVHDTAGGRRVQLQIAVAPAFRPLDVARAAAAAAASAATVGALGPVTTAVVVTDAG